MRQLFETPIVTCSLSADERLINCVWRIGPDMVLEDYKASFLRYLAEHVKYQCPLALHDQSLVTEFAPVEIQEWVGEQTSIHLPHTFLHRIASVVPPDFLVQLSIEQMVQEAALGVVTRFFDSREEAETWLRSPSDDTLSYSHLSVLH